MTDSFDLTLSSGLKFSNGLKGLSLIPKKVEFPIIISHP